MANDIPDFEPKFICDWCERDDFCDGDLDGLLHEDKDGNFHGVCRACLKEEATIENALAFSDEYIGEKEYKDTFIAELYTMEDLVALARKDLAQRLETNYAPDIDKIKKAAEDFCLFDDDAFIEFINSQSK